MRLPQYEYHAPESLRQALAIKSELGAAALVLAGGTDLVVQLKHGLSTPAALVSLKNLKELQGVRSSPDAVLIGAGTPLAAVAANEAIRTHFPVLVRAVESIGAVGIQHFRGTIGGNLCLTPRCTFYNQSLFWRQGKGPCHRTGGKECHALAGSESCQSACSGDTVPVLAALSAQVGIAGPAGERIIPLIELFSGKGETHLNLKPDEILTHVRVPMPWAPVSGSYQRLALRSAVDFPLVNAACVAIQENGKVQTFRLVLSALGPAPVMLKDLEVRIRGSQPVPEMADWASDAALKVAEGLAVANTVVSKEYRAKMASVMARRAVRESLGL
ncbi:MAG: FAD binding domain-containing protein [Thermodesulfobacteriota bacterium]